LTATFPYTDLGLIVNRSAGLGADRGTVEMVLTALGARRVVTGPGDLGAAFIDALRWSVDVVPVPEEGGAAQTSALARRIADRGVAAMAVIGGDGTLADAGAAISDRPDAPVVCGIGSGSMSVGQLITCTTADLDRLDGRRLRVHAVPALVATVGDKSALSFNDVVFGTTLVGTLKGRLRDLDAAAFVQGQRRPGRPQGIGQVGTIVFRTGSSDAEDGKGPGELVVARGRRVGGVVVGFTSSAYVGQAITGGICLGSWAGVPAGCVVSDIPLARVELNPPPVGPMRPIRSSYVDLGSAHRLVVEGARPGTVVVCDGNPLAVLEKRDRAEVMVRPAALRALRAPQKVPPSRVMAGAGPGDAP
jgi:hypothetical protein